MAVEEQSAVVDISNQSPPRQRKFSLDGRIEPMQITNLDSLHNLMISTRNVRRRIVDDLLHSRSISEDYVTSLKNALDALKHESSAFTRDFDYNGAKISMNIKDETLSCQKDLEFLEFLKKRESLECLTDALAAYHPVSKEAFQADLIRCRQMIQRLCREEIDLFITDWDGTMKNYCSTYSTCMQPAYSAVILSKFVGRFTKFAAVLTAGPLRNTGILDLVCVPDGYLIFGGSWGQEWILMGDHIVHDKQFSVESKAALAEFAERADRLLQRLEFRQFRMVGSGFQRKVDRVTIGHQNVSQDITEETQKRFLTEVYKIIEEIDPDRNVFTIHDSDLDVEIILRSRSETGDAKAFNKADGVRLIMEKVHRNIHVGNILVCGDTASDLPMVEYAKEKNPKTFAIFVNPRENVRHRLKELLDVDHCLCVGCPEVIHVAMAEAVFDDLINDCDTVFEQ